MRKCTDYGLVTESVHLLPNFIQQVYAWVEMGYEPLGSPIINNSLIIQAIVKYEEVHVQSSKKDLRDLRLEDQT